jgi:hypothetical protein
VVQKWRERSKPTQYALSDLSPDTQTNIQKKISPKTIYKIEKLLREASGPDSVRGHALQWEPCTCAASVTG